MSDGEEVYTKEEVEEIVDKRIEEKSSTIRSKWVLGVFSLVLIGLIAFPAMADVNIRDAGDLVLGEDTNIDANGNNVTGVDSIYYNVGDWPNFESRYGEDMDGINLLNALGDWDDGNLDMSLKQVLTMAYKYDSGSREWPTGQSKFTPAPVTEDGYILALKGIKGFGGMELSGSTTINGNLDLNGELNASSTNCGPNEAITGDGSCQSVSGSSSAYPDPVLDIQNDIIGENINYRSKKLNAWVSTDSPNTDSEKYTVSGGHYIKITNVDGLNPATAAEPVETRGRLTFSSGGNSREITNQTIGNKIQGKFVELSQNTEIEVDVMCEIDSCDEQASISFEIYDK